MVEVLGDYPALLDGDAIDSSLRTQAVVNPIALKNEAQAFLTRDNFGIPNTENPEQIPIRHETVVVQLTPEIPLLETARSFESTRPATEMEIDRFDNPSLDMSWTTIRWGERVDLERRTKEVHVYEDISPDSEPTDYTFERIHRVPVEENVTYEMTITGEESLAINAYLTERKMLAHKEELTALILAIKQTLEMRGMRAEEVEAISLGSGTPITKDYAEFVAAILGLDIERTTTFNAYAACNSGAIALQKALEDPEFHGKKTLVIGVDGMSSRGLVSDSAEVSTRDIFSNGLSVGCITPGKSMGRINLYGEFPREDKFTHPITLTGNESPDELQAKLHQALIDGLLVFPDEGKGLPARADTSEWMDEMGVTGWYAYDGDRFMARIPEPDEDYLQIKMGKRTVSLFLRGLIPQRIKNGDEPPGILELFIEELSRQQSNGHDSRVVLEQHHPSPLVLSLLTREMLGVIERINSKNSHRTSVRMNLRTRGGNSSGAETLIAFANASTELKPGDIRGIVSYGAGASASLFAIQAGLAT